MIISTLLFFVGMCCAYFFFGKLLTWIILEITESERLESFKESIPFYSLIGFISIVCFSGAFHILINLLKNLQ